MKNKDLRFVKLFMATLFFGATLNVSAQNFKTSKLFQSGMVLQRDVVVPIWGTADNGVAISAEWNNIKSDTVIADENGKWKISFPATNYGGPFDMNFYANQELVATYKDVYFGEVFYCSGQSNMELEVQSCNDYQLVKNEADDETIRQMKVSKGVSSELSDELPSTAWRPATSAYVGGFSAAAYFCVKELKKRESYKDIPFGILNVSYGGARVEAWMSKEMLGYDSGDIKLAAGESERQPTLIFNKMVNPLIGIPFKAMLWYQAESNCDNENDAKVYCEQFNNMINSYRNLWNMDFPVIWVQLPNYKSETRSEIDNKPSSVIASDPWIIMREQQTKSLDLLTNSAQIVTIDAGLAGNIHPTDKQTVGTRLALAVEKLVYGNAMEGAYSPRPLDFVKNEDGSVTIRFDVAEKVGQSLKMYEYKKTAESKLEGVSIESDSVSWFQIVDVNGKSSIAKATRIDDSHVKVEKGEADIATIYYAWNRCPGGMNLYMSVPMYDSYLPVTPFKLDVQSSDFGIKSFGSTKGTGEITAEGGSFVTFSWETGGDVKAYLNDVQVDPNSAAKVMLSETKDYTLKIVDNANPENVASQTIHFTVVPAKPTIKLTSKSGVLATPGDELEILSNAAAPGGFSVEKVEFYVNDKLCETATKAPFSFSWTAPDELGNYSFYGIVYNNNLDAEYNSAKSEILTISVTNMKKTRFEAEKALLNDKSGSSVQADDFCSGSKYLDLQEFNYVQFSGIVAPEDGDYQVCICYKAKYGYKEELLFANKTNLGNVAFEECQDWEILKMTMPLKKGENTITIKASWTWIQFDYIDILGVSNFATAIDDVKGVGRSMSVYCDTQSLVSINYQTEAPVVSFEVFDLNGRKLFQTSPVDANGSYKLEKHFESGVYVVKMLANNEILTQQVVVK